MRKRKQQKKRSKPETGNGSSRSVVEAEDVRPLVSGQSEYERERLLRMEENRVRMEALGLPKMAASFARNRRDESGDRDEVNLKDCNKDDDEDYNPNWDVGDEDTDELSSSSEGFVDEDDDEDYVKSKARFSSKNKNSGAKKKVPVQKQKQKLVDSLDLMDEDEALKKVIACSLKDSREALNESQRKAHSPHLTGKKKGRKLITNRVGMNEDDVVIHFCQLDEVGKGSITVRDLERMASSHDFTWTDKELMDMIRCFDKDGDGKLSIKDFRNIVVKCNMLQTSEDA